MTAKVFDFTLHKLRRMIADAESGRYANDEFLPVYIEEWRQMRALYEAGQAEIYWIHGEPHAVFPELRESRIAGVGPDEIADFDWEDDDDVTTEIVFYHDDEPDGAA